MNTASVALAALVIGLGSLASAQKEEPRATMWLAAAGNHQAGVVDAPVAMIRTWPRKQTIETVKQALRQSTDTAVLVKGLALHTDAAIFGRVSGEAAVAQRRATSAVLLDGESLGSSPRSQDWEIGRLIADALATRPASLGPTGAIPDGVAPARAWYHASSALLQQWADCGTLRGHLEQGLKAFPNDATLLLYRATLHQTFADPRVQVWITDAKAAAAAAGRVQRAYPARPRDNEDNVQIATDDPRPVARGASRGEIMQVGIPGDELRLAEGDLRAALASDPTLAEARIRLAHVLGLRGQTQEAAEQARLASAGALPPFLAYYAAMVLGRAEQDLGRHAEARAAFDRAMRLAPAAQSPRVALSRLAVDDGKTADSVALLIATSGPDAAPRGADDPWWSYFRLHEPDAKARLTAFRGLVR